MTNGNKYLFIQKNEKNILSAKEKKRNYDLRSKNFLIKKQTHFSLETNKLKERNLKGHVTHVKPIFLSKIENNLSYLTMRKVKHRKEQSI